MAGASPQRLYLNLRNICRKDVALQFSDDFSCYCSCQRVSDIPSVTLLASSRYLAIVRISRRGRGKKWSLGADAFSEQLVALRVTAIGAPVIHVSRGSLESKREATWEAGICANYSGFE